MLLEDVDGLRLAGKEDFDGIEAHRVGSSPKRIPKASTATSTCGSPPATSPGCSAFSRT